MPLRFAPRAWFAVLVLIGGCERADATASANPDANADSGAQAEVAPEAPPADAFEIGIINRCAEKWRYYVAPAEGGGGEAGATAGASEVVPDEEYTFLAPGESVRQRLRPGDVIWMVNRKGESTATGFQSKAEGDGGRVEINPDCETIKRVRMAPPGT